MVETGNKFHDNVSRLVSWAHWFTFFNLIMVSLISLRYIKYAGLSDTGLGIAYQFTSLLGHFSFVVAVVFGLLLFPLAFIIPYQRLYRLIAMLISTVAITFLIVDTQIFKLYDFHLTPLIWQFLQQPEQVEQIYSINLHYISIPIIFAIEFAISFFVWRKSRQLQAKAMGKPIAIFLFSTFVISHLAFVWADAKQYRPITQQKSLYPLSYPMTARTFLMKQGWLTEDKLGYRLLRQHGEARNSKLDYPKQPLSYLENDQRNTNKNILIISIESLRADLLNPKNMPFTYALSQKGLNYTKHFSGANNQAQGIYGLFYALPNRYWQDITLNYTPPVLMTRLQEQEYQFGLFSSIGFLHPEFSQSSFSNLDASLLQEPTHSGTNAQITKSWLQWLTDVDDTNNWFSFVFYQQMGDALALNESNFSLAQRTEKMAKYQQQVISIDLKIKELIEGLEASQQLQNSIVIITGTNGASFEKSSSPQAAINNAHVPLIVLWPGEHNRTITRMTSHVDIVPTLMEEMLGTKNTADQYSDGQSLFDNSPRPYLLSGDLNKYVIYEQQKITQFNNDGQISSINWQGIALNEDEFDITILIDVLSKLRRFND